MSVPPAPLTFVSLNRSDGIYAHCWLTNSCMSHWAYSDRMSDSHLIQAEHTHTELYLGNNQQIKTCLKNQKLSFRFLFYFLSLSIYSWPLAFAEAIQASWATLYECIIYVSEVLSRKKLSRNHHDRLSTKSSKRIEKIKRWIDLITHCDFFLWQANGN